jgi:hypothetical protein
MFVYTAAAADVSVTAVAAAAAPAAAGDHLVFFMPAFPETTVEQLHHHPTLRLVSNVLKFTAAAAAPAAGGRLVFFMPASPETYREDQLPCHPMLCLVSNVEQPLQSRYSRRLVTMVKVRQQCCNV